ncbi:MAG: hypothetical protein ACI82F_001391 [Planctomycetota bacterium]|jgi:hypothetical protein
MKKRAQGDDAGASGDSNDELEVVLNHLQARVEAEQKPSRFDARWLLMELGEVLQKEGSVATQARVARARKIVHRLGEAWDRAVRDELQIAATEHIQGVDPRFLSHPRYDLTYTLTARARLESRLLAAAALGTPLEESLAQAVERADRRLAEHQAKGPKGQK